MTSSFCLGMIFSENRFPLFRIMPQSFFGSDGIRTELQVFVLTHFLHANRQPLRSKML